MSDRFEGETDEDFATRLRAAIALEDRWAQKCTEWPHHRAQYARSAAEKRRQLAELTNPERMR